MSPFFRKLGWLWRRGRKEDELREELQFHLEEEADLRQEEGLARDQAKWAARRDLGNVTLVQESTRSSWSWIFVEQLGQDLSYALRTMINNPTFNLLAVLSLALGVGANTAIYSFMDSILLRSLPVPNPESLAVLNWHNQSRARDTVVRGGSGTIYDDAKTGKTAGIFPFPAFDALKKSEGVFQSVFAYYPTRQVNVMVKGQAELASGEFVSGDYFSGLNVGAAAGRPVIRDDDQAGAPPIVVLSFAYGQRHFGNAASAPGQSILINNVPFTVAGVAPPGFFGVDPATAVDFYAPLHTNLLLRLPGGPGEENGYLDEHYYWLEIMARLRPGVSLSRAQAALAPVFHQWVASTAGNEHERANLPELLVKEGASGLDTLRRRYSEPLYVLLTMVGLILAIACANVANLLLARAAARKREMAVRLSMGAGRLRVIRQLLTESVLLASIAGVAGVLFAVWGIRFLTVLLANGNERFTLHPELNWRVLAVAAGLSVLTGVLFGLAPALRSTRVDVMPTLRETRAGEPGARRGFRGAGLSRVLVVSQIGLTLLMLVAAGLFVRTLSNLQSIDLGFNREGLLLFQMNAQQAGHKSPEIIDFYGDLLAQFRGIPGVRTASLSQSPLMGEGSWMGNTAPIGKEPKGTTRILMTGPDFFATMQIPVLLGRVIDERDRSGSQAVAVVNEAYVKANFGGENPIGQHIWIRRRAPYGNGDAEVVGVVRNARYGELKGEFPNVLYVAYNQGAYYPVNEMTFALRTTGDPMRFAGTVREIVRNVDPRVPVKKINTQAAGIDQTLNQEIIFAKLCTGFAILALVIACVGLYGTMSYTVARRTGEIGIRMALGAQRGDVVWMVLREVLLLAAAGLVISVPTALGASKVVESFLYGVKANDAWTIIAAVAILMSAALIAGYVPARKACRIDPMSAVRHE